MKIKTIMLLNTERRVKFYYFTRLCLNLKRELNKAEEIGHRNRWQKYC